MLTEGKEDIEALARLSDDEFLAAWDTSLKQLTAGWQPGGAPYSCPRPVHHTHHDQQVCGAGAMGRLAAVVGRWAGADLASHLTSSGLQLPRAHLLASQMERLRQLTTSTHLSPKSREQLVDLQWKFGVVAGSSVEGEAGKTFVQLQFTSSLPDDLLSSHPKTRLVEMSLQEFYNFLHQLEKCKASLELMNCR